MAERLLMKHLDAPGKWIQERHRRLLMNKFCGRYLRDKRLHQFIIYSEEVRDKYEHNRRLRNPATTAVQQALHGLSYSVYGKPDVRRLMFEVFDFEQIQPKAVWRMKWMRISYCHQYMDGKAFFFTSNVFFYFFNFVSSFSDRKIYLHHKLW